MQRLMRDSSKTEAERVVQRQFSKTLMITGACLTLAVLLAHAHFNRLPNRFELGPRTLALRYQPQSVAPGSAGSFRVVGAWRLLTDDSRFGGISALAINRGRFVALTDSGVVARFPKPSVAAQIEIAELPGGPGSPFYKVNRDSEALAADPAGRGWWVAFENRDELWLYDRTWSKALARRPVPTFALARNRGIEGMVEDGKELLLFPERATKAIRSPGGLSAALNGVSGWISEAARLQDSRILIANRRPTPIGLSNSLIVLEKHGAAYRAAETWKVPVGRLDNVEALAVESMPGGGSQIWMMTDNNLQQRRPTLLIAVEFRPRPSRQP